MRFLCLHGQGTSAAIFKMQTAAIRYALGDDHTYEFVEGTRLSPMAPGLSSISSPEAPHYAYYDLHSASGFITALDQLEDYISAEGPFDGVLAFSQGAGLAAMHIVRKTLEGKVSPFKCAIFFSPNDVYDPAAWFEKQEVVSLDPAIYGQPIGVPTVVIFGESDPYADRSERVARLCDPGRSFVLRHPGGHEVPGLGVKESVPDAVKVMRRGITHALLGY